MTQGIDEPDRSQISHISNNCAISICSRCGQPARDPETEGNDLGLDVPDWMRDIYDPKRFAPSIRGMICSVDQMKESLPADPGYCLNLFHSRFHEFRKHAEICIRRSYRFLGGVHDKSNVFSDDRSMRNESTRSLLEQEISKLLLCAGDLNDHLRRHRANSTANALLFESCVYLSKATFLLERYSK